MSGRSSMNVPFFFPLEEKRRTRCVAHKTLKAAPLQTRCQAANSLGLIW